MKNYEAAAHTVTAIKGSQVEVYSEIFSVGKYKYFQ